MASIWRRPAVVVAIVGAIAAVVVAAIGVAGTWVGQPSAPPTDSRDEFLRIIDGRVDIAKEEISRKAKTASPEPRPSEPSKAGEQLRGGTSQLPKAEPSVTSGSAPSAELSSAQLLQNMNEISELQRKHAEAVKEGRLIEAHELLKQINQKIKDSGLDDRYQAGLPTLSAYERCIQLQECQA